MYSYFHFVFQQIRVMSTEKLVIYLCLSVILLVSRNLATSDVCHDQQPDRHGCTCTPFGSKGFVVKCMHKGLTQVPRGLPLKTLWL